MIGYQGDDTFIYTSGNDVIVGSSDVNYGYDTLDLSQYDLADVTFSSGDSYDVLITTADGVIELDYQTRYAVGDSRANIDEIIFADGVLDEQGILDRVASDDPMA